MRSELLSRHWVSGLLNIKVFIYEIRRQEHKDYSLRKRMLSSRI